MVKTDEAQSLISLHVLEAIKNIQSYILKSLDKRKELTYRFSNHFILFQIKIEDSFLKITNAAMDKFGWTTGRARTEIVQFN